MRNEKIRSVCLAATIVFGMQSLVDMAQKEAERRQQLDIQGVQEKVIEGEGASLAPNGNLTVSTPPGTRSQTIEAPAKDQKNRTSIRSYRSALQKLDRAIRQYETRIESLLIRLESEKKRISRNDRTADTQSRIQEQIDELRLKIEQANKDRSTIFQSGKKEGYLPGELDGKGIIP